ncbi:Cell division cycle-related protein res2/pct1 [Spathaspora sp. JA1]|nr:Cell division cycle-related protein res2/pct1 [Spathaspora sp. JA1]
MNDSPIMRRCKDDWVNATQILKCCNFPKAKRTKILEKGVQSGSHEKVQGGFGRFQGTWIPLEDARRLAATYGVTKESAPVLFMDFSDPNLVIPQKVKPQPKEPSLVKRKYVKKLKPMGEMPTRKYNKDKKEDANNSFSGDSFNGISRQNSYIPPNNGQYMHGYPPQPLQQQQQQQQQLPPSVAVVQGAPIPQGHNPQHHQQIPAQQFQPPSQATYTHQEYIPNMNGHDGNYPNEYNYSQIPMQEMQQIPMEHQKYYNVNGKYPVSVPLVPPQQQQPQHQQRGSIQYSQPAQAPSSQSSNDTNWSQRESDTSINSLDEMKMPPHNKDEQQQQQQPSTYAAQLLKFFSEDNSEVPYFIHYPSPDFNINEPIDDEGHTALHWAASIGNYQMIHLLLSKGANPLVVNNFGLNPLSKLISFNNCFELKNFPKVLDDLELCLINTDINGRTPLHYLGQFSKIKTKFESLRYYLNAILNKLTTLSTHQVKQIDLLNNVLNHQDVNGDTCLHIAIKAGCAKIVQLLLQYGARDDLENVQRETSKMLIGQYGLIPENTLDMPMVYRPQVQTQAELGTQQQVLQPQQQQQQQQQLPPQHYYNSQVVATPIQNFKAETPDTQRTIQEEDDDEEEVVARVDKQHLDALNNDNVFINKSNKSTPLQRMKATKTTQLSVIHEKYTVPYQPNPPELDKNGKLVVNGNNEDPKPAKKLEMSDLASMITGMINSLGDLYTQDMHNLEKEITQLEVLVNTKNIENQESRQFLKKLLGLSGIEEEIETVEEGQDVVIDKINSAINTLNDKESELHQVLKTNQTSMLSKLVHSEEIDQIEKSSEEESSPEAQLNDAIELTRLQLNTDKLVREIGERTKLFAVDQQMYKYRKLISLSCGLRIEDIDGLLDGIEESLLEGMS